MIEEDERADHAALQRRQHAAHAEPAEIARPAPNDQLDRLGGVIVAFWLFVVGSTHA
jgi:hypothetical protein